MIWRVSVTIGVLAAAVVLLAGLAAGGPAAKPQVRVDSLKPFAVVGTGFRRGETVRVTVRTDAGVASKRDEASSAGRIAVRFPRLKLGRCPDNLLISARGDEGSRAVLRSVPGACGIDPGHPSRND